MATTYKSIGLVGPTKKLGTLEFQVSGIAWSPDDTGHRVQVNITDVDELCWWPGSAFCILAVTQKDGRLVRFDGFQPHHYEGLNQWASSKWEVPIIKRVASIKGRSWGGAVLEEKTLQWRDDDDDPVATIPLASLEAVMAPGKHEVELQFVLDDSATRGDDVVSNLRFFVPPDHELAAEAMEGMDAAATLATKIRAAAGLSSVSGELVAEIPGADTMFLVPRGRFSINLYMTFLRLEGNTNSYKISYKNLARCTYLPRPNPAGDAATRFLLVLSLNQPLRQGQQSYAHLVMQVDNNPHECTLQVAEETRAESFPKLPPVVSGDRPKVIAQLIRHIAGVPVYRPKNFESKLKFKCVRCSYKSSEGLLYPLDGSLMFVHKPTLFIQYGEISQMIFQRVNASNVNASFDVEVHLKAAGSTSKVYTFGQVEGRERDILQQYFIAAGINVQINTTGNANAAAVASAIDAEMAGSEDGFGEDSEDSEDSEFDYGGPTGRSDDSASSGEEDGDDDDAGAAGSPAQAGTKRRRAGDAKESVLAADGGDDDDDDE